MWFRLKNEIYLLWFMVPPHPSWSAATVAINIVVTGLGTRKSEQQVTSRPAITWFLFYNIFAAFLYVVEKNSELSRLEESQLEILIWLYSLEEVAGVLDGNLMFCTTTTLREFKDRNTSSDLAGHAVLAETLVSQDDSLKWNRMVDEVKKNKH